MNGSLSFQFMKESGERIICEHLQVDATAECLQEHGDWIRAMIETVMTNIQKKVDRDICGESEPIESGEYSFS